MSLTAVLAGRLAGPLFTALGSRATELLLGPKQVRAAEKVIKQAATRLVQSLPEDPGQTGYLVSMLTRGEIAELLVASALPGATPLDVGLLGRRLHDLGYDHRTADIDLVEQAVALRDLIAEGLAGEIEKPDSPLFNTFVSAQLSDLSTRIERSTDGRTRRVDPMLPALPDPFLGRDADLAALLTRLDPGLAGQRTTVVRGWPGVGKSSMAAAVGYDRKIDTWFPDGVLWAALSETPDVSGQLDIWLRRLHLDPASAAESMDTKKKLLAGRLRNARLLLIVDDAWLASDALPFLGGGPGCGRLVTTRITEVARGLGGEDYVLPILPDDVALDLVTRLAGGAVAGNRPAVLALVRELEGLPLALRVAARLLAADHQYGWGVDDLLAELREGSRLLREQAPADRTDLARATTPTVATLLARSTDRLSPEMRIRFARLGAFASRPATFDLPAIAAQWKTSDPRPSIAILVDRGLLEPDGRGRYQMHALLSLHARAILRGR